MQPHQKSDDLNGETYQSQHFGHMHFFVIPSTTWHRDKWLLLLLCWGCTGTVGYSARIQASRSRRGWRHCCRADWQIELLLVVVIVVMQLMQMVYRLAHQTCHQWRMHWRHCLQPSQDELWQGWPQGRWTSSTSGSQQQFECEASWFTRLHSSIAFCRIQLVVWRTQCPWRAIYNNR